MLRTTGASRIWAGGSRNKCTHFCLLILSQPMNLFRGNIIQDIQNPGLCKIIPNVVHDAHHPCCPLPTSSCETLSWYLREIGRQ